jgi:phosphohistidine phosphatase
MLDAKMLLTLVRHGDAGAPTNDLGDAGRCLSPIGREQARTTGRALAAREVTPSLVWSSPLVRAVQTAELLVAPLPYAGPVVARDDLYPDSLPRSLFAALRQLDEDADVLVVGHMPYMATAASELLDLHVSGFSTAAALRIEVTELPPNRARLKWRFVGRFVD